MPVEVAAHRRPRRAQVGHKILDAPVLAVVARPEVLLHARVAECPGASLPGREEVLRPAGAELAAAAPQLVLARPWPGRRSALRVDERELEQFLYGQEATR